VAEALICAGCGLLCDDATVELAGGEARLRPACAVGERWLNAHAPRSEDLPEATVDGAATDFAAALDRAAELLRGARRPLVHGFAQATTEDARAAVALADRIGAIVATAPPDEPRAPGPALALRGASSATLGEIRDRAGLVIVWREDPQATHPRLLQRLGFGPGAQRSRLAAERTLVVVDDRETDTARQADVRLRWPADEDLGVLRWLLAERRGTAGRDAPFASDLSRLLLDAAAHAAIVYGPGLTGGPGGERRALALHELVRALDDDRHVVTLALPATAGGRGADDVLTWQTGFSGIVDLGPDHPAQLAGTAPLIESEGVDVALRVAGAGDAMMYGVTEIALSALASPQAAVAIRTAAPALTATGTAHRLDGVPLTLAAPLQDGRNHPPTAASVLHRLTEALSG
jgi:formylmethanofuran dehydrogenase subunit B